MTAPGPVPAGDPLAAVAALPGVGEAAGRARDAVDAVLRHRALRTSLAAVTVECSLRAAVAAADLEIGGLHPAWDLDAVRAAVRSGELAASPVAGATGSLPALRAAVHVSAEAGHLLPTFERAPLQALARLHVVAAAGVLAPAALGRPRSGQEPPDVLGLGAAPPAEVVPARLAAVARLLTEATTASGVVVAAVVHAEVLTLRPFAWGNGIVALAAQRLVLAARGIDPRAVTVPEWGHLDLGREAYARAARSYVSGTAGGVGAWVRHCARAIQIGAREGLALCETLARSP